MLPSYILSFRMSRRDPFALQHDLVPYSRFKMVELPRTGNMRNASYTTNKATFNGSKYDLKYLKLELSISCA